MSYLSGVSDVRGFVMADLAACRSRLHESHLRADAIVRFCAEIHDQEGDEWATQPWGYAHSLMGRIVVEKWPVDLDDASIDTNIKRDLRLQAAMRLFVEAPQADQPIAAAFLELIHERLVDRPEWHNEGRNESRQDSARRAANARHAKPDGSRAKQAAIRSAWASGRYTSRDRCAEEECGALNMSLSAARRALRNTPNPV